MNKWVNWHSTVVHVSDNHADMLHAGKLKKGRSLNRTDKYKANSLATSAPIKRLNDQWIPQQDINPKKIVDMDMNNNTSATDTYPEGASKHNLEESKL